MDSWIAKRIRTVSLRRFVVWTILPIGGVLLATNDHRYIANFVGGPYKLGRADLDSIRDVALTPRYYARVSGDTVLDTGLRQYTVHTENGVDTSREESSAYAALVLGNRYLVVRTGGGESRIAEGKLVPWSDDLEAQLFDSKEMQAVRSRFYRFYLDTDSFRRPGYIVIGVAIVFLLLFAWQAMPAWRSWRHPDGHPVARRIAQWGDPIGTAAEAEHDYENALVRGKGGWRLGNKFLAHASFFSFNLFRMNDVLWAHKKITKHSVNFIPTGKSYAAIVYCYGGTATIGGSEKRVNEILGFVQQRAPWAIYGYSAELAAMFSKNNANFVRSVEQRRQEWAAKSAS